LFVQYEEWIVTRRPLVRQNRTQRRIPMDGDGVKLERS